MHAHFGMKAYLTVRESGGEGQNRGGGRGWKGGHGEEGAI